MFSFRAKMNMNMNQSIEVKLKLWWAYDYYMCPINDVSKQDCVDRHYLGDPHKLEVHDSYRGKQDNYFGCGRYCIP